MKKALLLAAVVAATASSAPPNVQAAQRYVSIGTGGVTGVYFPAGGAICRLVNKGRKTHGIRCAPESTGGSVDNIHAVKAGELDFGIAQSDWQHHAYHGTSKFEKEGKFDKLRAIFSIHPEPFTLIARKGANIAKFENLKGKKVNIGNAGSGQRATIEVVMSAFGIEKKDFALAAELKGSEMAQAVCDSKIDAMIYTIGHPAAAVTEAATTCDVELINVVGAPIEKLIAENPFYRAATVPGGMYRGVAKDVLTFGVDATFMTSADVSEKIVYTVVKSVFENFSDFKKLHPAFVNLKEKDMISNGLSAPIHDGAMKYYKERGWVK